VAGRFEPEQPEQEAAEALRHSRAARKARLRRNTWQRDEGKSLYCWSGQGVQLAENLLFCISYVSLANEDEIKEIVQRTVLHLGIVLALEQTLAMAGGFG
jgi:hypothetical protein